MKSIIKPVSSWLVAPALVLLLAGCSSDADYDFEASIAESDADVAVISPPQALFNPDPSAAILPFPNNLLFVGGEDGTLNIPISPDADQTLANPQIALNQQDGFSTTSPIVTSVSESLDPETLTVGETVRVFEVTTPVLPVDGTTAAQRAAARSAITSSVVELTAAQLSVFENGNQLVLIPREPLKPSTSYMVVLTDGILDTQGDALTRSLVYGLLQGDDALADENLEALRGIVGSHSAVLNMQLGINTDNVVLSWVFTTQSIREVLQATKDNSTVTTLTLAATGQTTSQANEQLQGKADLFIGGLVLPYYQTAVGDDGNPLPALNGFWTNTAGNVPGATDENGIPDYIPAETSQVTVPVLMTVPNGDSMGGGEMPENGWPVTIFQHGINGNRTFMLAIADAMADAGRAVIAIDMPMHGLTDPGNLLHADNNPLVTMERTFGIDVVSEDPATGSAEPGADGVTDSSGRHFYNLANLANTRDNFRQAIADLFVLTENVIAFSGEELMLDASNLNFVGHSLGGIVGTTMLSYDNRFQTATLGMPGGGIAQLLANSERFGPVINSGLAGNGIETGSSAYNQFLTAAQTMIDSGDPINHASILAADGSTRLHLIEVIGDAVIPNTVPTAPLSGTEPLIAFLGLPAVDETVMDSSAAVRFIAGDHGSLLSPEASFPATVEMQRQMAAFAAFRGTTLPVDNSDNIIQVVE